MLPNYTDRLSVEKSVNIQTLIEANTVIHMTL